MPLQICVDDPFDREIKHPVCRIRGWCAARDPEDLDGLEFRIAGHRVPAGLVPRPDVEETHAGQSAKGFLLDLDLSHHLPGIHKREFVLEVITTYERVRLRFRVSREALGKCLEAASSG
jgi:hypothetical protein